MVAYKRLKTIGNHSTFKAQNAGVCPVLAPVEGLFSNRTIGQICLNIYFCFILLFTSPSPCLKDHSAVFTFSASFYCTNRGIQLGDPTPL